jgi:polyhydroxyalkanoate synthesis repressor PhaR
LWVFGAAVKLRSTRTTWLCVITSLKPEGGSLVNQEVGMASKASTRTKIIKRYQNRKLYDTQQSCYVTLDDIAKMIRANEEVMVIDNKTKNDITSATLTQIIFEAEKKAAQYAPLFTLREIIQNGNGSISSFLAKLGAFPKDYAEQQQAQQVVPEVAQEKVEITKPSVDDVKQTLEERVANAANSVQTTETTASPFTSDLPDLPNSNNKILGN